MDILNLRLRKIRDYSRYIAALVLIWLYLPHLLFYLLTKSRSLIVNDVRNYKSTINIELSRWGTFLFLVHNDEYFRKLFYHRIGLSSILINWWRPGDKYFIISKTTKIGGGVYIAHPYSTIINAHSVGCNFSVRHLTTIGNKGDDNTRRPVILDHVTLGANVSIIGDITIGNHVTIGAGSVVTKSVPDHCTVVGNPARIIIKNGVRVNEKL